MGLRIISGNLKGKKLNTVRGLRTRPTSDRLRESLFNILSNTVKDAVTLDLFAGTGAFGIETLSRGARSAVFIDNYTPALTIIKKNVESCAVSNCSRVIHWDILNNLNCIKAETPVFNLVFMDPPYNNNFIKKTFVNLHRSKALINSAKIIVEHSPSEPIPENDQHFKTSDRRKYGKTIVSFLNYMI